MKRLSDIVEGHIKAAIEGLDILAVDRDQIEWEACPFVSMDSSVGWLVGIGLPVRVTGDSVMPFAPIDPHSPDAIAHTVRVLYAKAVADVAEQTKSATSAANGHGKPGEGLSPGGLIIP
jgi:hypothetical protein